MAHILVVDDDESVRTSIKEILEDSSLTVTLVGSGSEALTTLQDQHIDLIVLDIIMPEMDGIEVCRRIRADPLVSRIPILMLTARGRSADIAQGLDAGADDYLVKPYDVIELPARVRAHLRRAPGAVLDSQQEYMTFGNLRLNLIHPKIDYNGTPIQLTPTEYRLLHYLIIHTGKVLPVDQLLQDIWEYPAGVGDPQLARVHLNNLRAKLEEYGLQYIQNIHGRGYTITLA